MTHGVATLSATVPPASVPARAITYLSAPAAVSMADRWFEIASIEHFWVRRRFEVLQYLGDDFIPSANNIAEIGCGHGLLQLQLENEYGKEVTGFDLNEVALKQNVSRISKVCCYDIFQQLPTLCQSFDLIFLFDVLEHISDEHAFLNAVLFHLAPHGKLVINVPAGQWAFSKYDEAAGHVRRYSIETLRQSASASNLQLQNWSYWGLPLIPTLAVRKLWLLGQHDPSRIISSGFDSRSFALNQMLLMLSRCEFLPQQLHGTSLMAVFENSASSS
jgi:2-polyprenyl-3-methyl-5-hydroxy-6-metoxy-1,4-benzoquinol methylase